MNLNWLLILALGIAMFLPLACSSSEPQTAPAPTAATSAASVVIASAVTPVTSTARSIMSSVAASPTRSIAPATTLAVALDLPAPRLHSDVSLEETLATRRSVRAYADLPLSVEEISQLLWATQGITADWGGRTAPSAGGTYPLEVYLVAGNTQGLASGVYRYKPDGHRLVKIRDGDLRTELAAAALDQAWVKEAPVTFVIAAVYERTTERYGERGLRYVHMEAGHAAQNTCLEATALNLGAVTIGAFHDDRVKSVLKMPANEEPLYVIPAGRLKS